MFEEKFFRPKIKPVEEKKPETNPEPENKTPAAEKSTREKEMSRRDFLKFLGASAALPAVESISGKVENAEASLGILKKTWNKIKGPELIVYHKNNDLKTVDKVLNLKSKNQVIINEDVARDTEKFWKMEHLGNPKYSDSLYWAYKEMEKNWSNDLRKIFNEEGVPEKFIYLAIPESYWKWEKDSPAGARGPYQIMANTGRSFGLKIDGKIDDRLKPLESGRACAKYLKYLHDITNDWDLTLSGYNGGLIWDYIGYARSNSQGLSYKNFLEYLSSETSRYKKEYLTGNHSIKVEKNDTLRSLAAKYTASEKAIMRANGLKTKKIEPGSRIIIPVKSRRMREEVLAKRKATLSENLNYPPKFNAVLEIIEEGIS